MSGKLGKMLPALGAAAFLLLVAVGVMQVLVWRQLQNLHYQVMLNNTQIKRLASARKGGDPRVGALGNSSSFPAREQQSMDPKRLGMFQMGEKEKLVEVLAQLAVLQKEKSTALGTAQTLELASIVSEYRAGSIDVETLQEQAQKLLTEPQRKLLESRKGDVTVHAGKFLGVLTVDKKEFITHFLRELGLTEKGPGGRGAP